MNMSVVNVQEANQGCSKNMFPRNTGFMYPWFLIYDGWNVLCV